MSCAAWAKVEHVGMRQRVYQLWRGMAHFQNEQECVLWIAGCRHAVLHSSAMRTRLRKEDREGPRGAREKTNNGPRVPRWETCTGIASDTSKLDRVFNSLKFLEVRVFLCCLWRRRQFSPDICVTDVAS